MIRFSLLCPLDTWIFRINADYRETIPFLLRDDHFRKRTDIRRKYSDLSIVPMTDRGGPFLVKKMKYQIMADQIRRFWGRSQAQREFRSARILDRLNVSCPTPILAGTNLSPWGDYESLFVYRYIRGYVTGTDFLRKNREVATREALFRAVAKDLALIHANGLFHKDSHFGNILYCPQETVPIYWIDNDVKKTGTKFEVYEKLALERFRKALKKSLISLEEWRFFIDHYHKSLAGT